MYNKRTHLLASLYYDKYAILFQQKASSSLLEMNITMNTSDANITMFPPNDIYISPKTTNMNILIDVAYYCIAIVGFCGNAVAVYIISSSTSIKQSKSYILLVNQCLFDIIYNVFILIYIVARPFLKNKNMSGIIDWFSCSVIHSQVLVGAMLTSSSYNLCALALERMICILFPIFHRVRITERVLKMVAAFIWILGPFLMFSLAIPSSYITPNGTCYFWNGFDKKWSLFIAISTNIIVSIFPFIIMIVAFAAMYIRIHLLGLKVRMNVIRMLGTCVILFCICHCLHSSLSIIMTWFKPNDPSWHAKPIFRFAQLLMQLNSLVNPFVFYVQYTD